MTSNDFRMLSPPVPETIDFNKKNDNKISEYHNKSPRNHSKNNDSKTRRHVNYTR